MIGFEKKRATLHLTLVTLTAPFTIPNAMPSSDKDAKTHSEPDADRALGVMPNLNQERVETEAVSPGVLRIKAMVAVMTRGDFALLCLGVLLVAYIRK